MGTVWVKPAYMHIFIRQMTNRVERERQL